MKFFLICFIFLISIIFTTFGFTNPSYDTSTGILTIPNLDINGTPTFIDVSLLLKSDGTYSVLEIKTPPITNTTFPYTDKKDFDGESIGDLISSNDGSVWKIKGITGSSIEKWEENNYTIYYGTGSLEDPVNGTKTDYYMLIDGVSMVFFVEPISYKNTILTDKKDFDGESIGDLISSNDGSVWKIKGITGSSIEKWEENNYTIYYGTDSLENPVNGTKTDYFMLIDGVSMIFFITPI
ncbi:MAG: hypothetical protein HOG71_00355 [Bacteroidetes bacterium]|nr:hypothetical protein [Bacteroidota bacterium]